jgi:hypothetical protein
MEVGNQLLAFEILQKGKAFKKKISGMIYVTTSALWDMIGFLLRHLKHPMRWITFFFELW